MKPRVLKGEWSIEKVPPKKRVWARLTGKEGIHYGWMRATFTSFWADFLIYLDNGSTVAPEFTEDWGEVSAVDQLAELADE